MRLLRGVILALFIISLLGPWMFDLIYVPAEYSCTFRLDGDFCGVPMSGFLVFYGLAGSFFFNLVAWVSGTFTGRAREFFVGLFVLIILLPFFTTLVFVWKKETRRLQMINLVAWILALLLPLALFISQINKQAIQLWGICLYIIVAVGAVIIEITLLRRKTTET